MTETLLIKLIAQIQPEYEKPITKDSLLADLELSSLDMMILICEMERYQGTDISFAGLQDAKTVEELCANLTNKKSN